MPDATSLRARIVYWGIEGAGKTTNLQIIHSKLRPNNRGDLQRVATRIDSTVSYETLPIQLGEVGGIPTQIDLVTVPDGAEQAPTRLQLLDEVSGIVLVLDARPARADENHASCRELSTALEAYGRSLNEVPLVVQYNKRDLCDDNAVEALHKQLALPAAAMFEAVATEGTGVLQTLTTLSKRVVRNLRDSLVTGQAAADASAQTAAAAQVGSSAPVYDPEALARRAAAVEPQDALSSSPAASATQLMERAMEAEALASEADNEAATALEFDTRAAFDRPFDSLAQESADEAKPPSQLALGPDLRIVSIGTATREGDRAVRIPIVLGDASGATASLALTIQLDPLLDESR